MAATAVAPVGTTTVGAQVLDKLTKLGERLSAVETQVAHASQQRLTGAVPNRVPWARKGEDPMSSRGFSFAKVIGHMAGIIPEEQAKVELGLSRKMVMSFTGKGYVLENPRNSQLAPMAPGFFSRTDVDDETYEEMKGLLYAGVSGADRDEMAWLQKKMFAQYGEKAATAASPSMSWIDTSAGGAFVPPAMFGEPIELLRNKEVLMSAGATVMPLGPSGRVIMPRLTSATQGGWVGENEVQAPVNPVTGTVTLGGKKVMGIVVLPGEFLRFATPAGETIVRNDLFKTVALIADLGYLHGSGSDKVPLGLFTMGTTSIASNTAGTVSSSSYGSVYVNPSASNVLAPQDFSKFIAGIEENNGEPTAWIMRPLYKAAISQARWTPYSGGTSQGGFVFDLTRKQGDNLPETLEGKRIIASAQVSNTRGSGAQTCVAALDATDYFIGLFGAIEFFQTDQGWTLASSDQVLVRALLTTDGVMRHPGLLAVSDALSFSVSG